MRRSDVIETMVTPLDRRSRVPFYRQVYERLRVAIAQGTLQPSERLPSARILASQLTTARGTIDAAYNMLAGEGYIVTRGAAGTYVAAAPLGGASGPASSRPRRARAREHHVKETSGAIPLQMGLPALDVFPRKLWARLATRHARTLSFDSMVSPDPLGYLPLREAIGSYLAVSRGIQCSTRQIIVTSGFQGTLGLLSRTLLDCGDEVWMEEPGYPFARMGLQAAGARLVPVPVDEHGMDVAAGIARAPSARLAYVTPAHQAPLGVGLSLQRRMALLEWARRNSSWIIEDDYDSELSYFRPPLPALKSLDRDDRVVYAGSWSKVLFPGLRLGYCVVPESELARVSAACHLLYRDLSLVPQKIVADFMTRGHFARHVKRMRALYAERREALADALAQVFQDGLQLQASTGGMHLTMNLEAGAPDIALVTRAKVFGVRPGALSTWYIDKRSAARGLLLSFTNVPCERSIEVVERLKQAIDR